MKLSQKSYFFILIYIYISRNEPDRTTISHSSHRNDQKNNRSKILASLFLIIFSSTPGNIIVLRLNTLIETSIVSAYNILTRTLKGHLLTVTL